MQATHMPLSAGEAILIGLAVLAITVLPLLWTPVEHFYTMGHEAAHALLAIFLGFSVAEIVLDRHSNGVTRVIAGEGLRLVLVGIAGYLGPSVFGLAAARLISLGYPVTVIWLTVVLLVLLMFLISRSFGLLSVPIAIAVLIGILRYAHGRPEVFIAYGLAWLLLLSGVRVAIADGIKAEDAHSLRRSTHLPRALWALIWLAGTVGALIVGGSLLVLG
ncbi:MAG: M50 family metallopeptidase [Trebonia sp.]